MSKQPETQLWLLRARLDLPLNNPADFDDHPWAGHPWDKCYGMVVEAATEERAREIANTVRGDDEVGTKFKMSCYTESDDDECLTGDHRGELTDCKNEGRNVWLDPKYTTCIPLVCTGEERRVIWDVLRG